MLKEEEYNAPTEEQPTEEPKQYVDETLPYDVSETFIPTGNGDIGYVCDIDEEQCGQYVHSRQKEIARSLMEDRYGVQLNNDTWNNVWDKYGNTLGTYGNSWDRYQYNEPFAMVKAQPQVVDEQVVRPSFLDAAPGDVVYINQKGSSYQEDANKVYQKNGIPYSDSIGATTHQGFVVGKKMLGGKQYIIVNENLHKKSDSKLQGRLFTTIYDAETGQEVRPRMFGNGDIVYTPIGSRVLNTVASNDYIGWVQNVGRKMGLIENISEVNSIDNVDKMFSDEVRNQEAINELRQKQQMQATRDETLSSLPDNNFFQRVLNKVTGKEKKEYETAKNSVVDNEWEIVKDLDGFKTHEQGGVQLDIQDGKVHFTSGDSKIHARYGMFIPGSPDEPVREEPKKKIYNNKLDWSGGEYFTNDISEIYGSQKITPEERALIPDWYSQAVGKKYPEGSDNALGLSNLANKLREEGYYNYDENTPGYNYAGGAMTRAFVNHLKDNAKRYGDSLEITKGGEKVPVTQLLK